MTSHEQILRAWTSILRRNSTYQTFAVMAIKCYLKDMLAGLHDTVVPRNETNMFSVKQIPQVNEKIRCNDRLSDDIVDMLRDKTRFAVQFAKFIPMFHNHFERQCKLINLVYAMPNTVRLFTNDIDIQLVQLTKTIMLDLVCENLVQSLESNNNKLQLDLIQLDNMYRNRYWLKPLVFVDFDCTNIEELLDMLPLGKCYIHMENMPSKPGNTPLKHDIVLMVEPLDKHEIKRSCKLALKRLFDETDGALMLYLSQQIDLNKRVPYTDILTFLFDADDLPWARQLNRRSLGFQIRLLSDFITFDADENVTGLSDIYDFGKFIRFIFIKQEAVELDIEVLKYYCIKQTASTQAPENFYCFKKFGFVDVNMLFSQGVNLIVSMGEEKRIILNQEFLPGTVEFRNSSFRSNSCWNF